MPNSLLHGTSDPTTRSPRSRHTVAEDLFDTVVTDLDAVCDHYRRAGLLTEGGAGSLAWTLMGGGEEADHFRRDVLLLDALVRHRVARLVFNRTGPHHIVVFGGNNVGKSTVVNILAAASLADTSPEGGHTRHAHAFSAAADPLFAWNPYAFNRFTEATSDQSPASQTDCYTIHRIVADALPDSIVVWDSPDCDAVGSARYVASVIEAAAAADLVVYVTSVEKYAVADLVDWLFLLADAGILLLGCLNKTPRKDRLLVIQKQADQVFPAMSQRLGLPVPVLPMVALRYLADGEEADLWGPDHPEATELRNAALARLGAQDELQEAHRALRFAQQRISRVLEPARQELAVRDIWRETVSDAVAAFVATYETAYLTGGSVIDPFKQLNAALLELLNPEIPRLHEVIRGLRAVQRLPTDLLRRGWRWVSELGEGSGTHLGSEQKAYANAHQALLQALTRRVDAERRQPRHHPFWDRLAAEWPHHIARLAEDFRQATLTHMEMTDREVRTAAQDILKALQQRPGVLNLLRTARVSTDIGGLLVGFVIPGHGSIVHDLLDQIVIAPLMLGATGAAAEVAVEGYVAQRRGEIIEQLRKNAREMANTLYLDPLNVIGDAVMTQVGMPGIERDLLDRLPANLARLQQEIARRPVAGRLFQ